MNLSEEIIQSLPRVCPIESVENYHHNSHNWDAYINSIQESIDEYHYVHFFDADLEELKTREFQFNRPRFPTISLKSVILNACFGQKDNQIIDGQEKDINNIKYNLSSSDDDSHLKEVIKEISDYNKACNPEGRFFIDDSHLFNLTKELNENEFLCEFNNSLLQYAKKKLALEKKNDLDTRDSQWERSVRELVHWFSNNKLEIKTDSESKTETNNALWAIADDMRSRKDEGEFDTYRDAYRWAEKNISKKGVDITFMKLEKAYHKASSAGTV